MKMAVLLLVLFTCISVGFATTKESYTVENRQLYAQWSTLDGDGCAYEYFYVSAYEYETHIKGQVKQDPSAYLYYYHYVYDYCTAEERLNKVQSFFCASAGIE